MGIPGMITLPMTFLSGRTPLDCTIHPGLWQISSNQTYEFDEFEFTGSISSQDMVFCPIYISLEKFFLYFSNSNHCSPGTPVSSGLTPRSTAPRCTSPPSSYISHSASSSSPSLWYSRKNFS